MAEDALIAQLKTIADDLIGGIGGLFLVQIRIKPTNNIKVFIDGDQGVTVADTINLNRKLYPLIEAEKLFPDGDFSLEVSSAGIGEPLLLHRQYVKNIGRWLAVQQVTGEMSEGQLKEVNEEEIVLEQQKGKGKKAETLLLSIPFSNIKKAVVEVKF